jgi:release factor glutamine methyltransferase
VNNAPAVRATLVREGAARLASADVGDADREVWWMWQRVSGETRGRSFMLSEESPDPLIAERFFAALERRCAGEPLAYVLGETTFRELTIACDPRALIPRPETEGLVELVLARRSTGRVLEIGTGTGCIALSLANEGRYSCVVASDVSAEALALARRNIAVANLPVHLIRGNLSSMVTDAAFDVVISNPPYLTRLEYERLSPTVKAWEPIVALVGGEDGLEATRGLLGQAFRVVRSGGLIGLEVDCSRAHEVGRIALEVGWREVMVRDDLFGRARYLLAWRS